MIATPNLQLLALTLLFGLVFVAYHESLASMVDLWPTQSYRHAYLIPIISAGLLWMDRSRLSGLEWRPWLPPLIGLAFGTWLLWMGRNTLIQSLEHVALFVILISFLMACTGWNAFRQMAFPLLFLAFAVPVGREFNSILMEVTASIPSTLLLIVGLPVFREGMFLTLPGGNFEIADVCSGYNYLNTGISLCCLLAYTVVRGPLRGVTFVAAAGVWLLFMNGFRAFVTMWVASATNMQYMVGDDHLVFGWVLFFATMVVLYWVSTKLAVEPAHARP